MTIYGWHFSDGTLANGDGRKITPGMALACRADEIELCAVGFHASRAILDALSYANAPFLSYVLCEGKVIEGEDILVCSQRRHLAIADISVTLHEFACWCAEQALSLIDNPDPRSIAAIDAKRKWMRGEISDDDLAAVAAAAWAAAWAASWTAAWAAVRAAQEARLRAMVFALPELSMYVEN